MFKNSHAPQTLKNRAILAAACAAVGTASLAQGSQIGLDFSDNATGAMSGSTNAGAVVQAGNTYTQLNLGTTSANTGTFNSSNTTFKDSTGYTIAGMSVSYGATTGTTGWFYGYGASDGSHLPTANDQNLYNGYLGTNSTSSSDTAATVTISGIPASYAASGYQVYVYFSSNQATTSGSTTYYARDLSSSGSGLTFYNTGNMNGNASGTLSSYVDVTSQNSASPTFGDYAVFPETGITSVTYSFSFVSSSFTNAVHVYGFQIVPVPEPASLGLIGAMGAGALLRRRRRIACG